MTSSPPGPALPAGAEWPKSRRRNKVPEPNASFWSIQILATVAGETGADFLSRNPSHQPTTLTAGAWVVFGLLLAALLVQIRSARYVPGIYWLTVVLASIGNTLIADRLSNGFGTSLIRTAVALGGALMATVSTWYFSERTLSVHAVVARRQEVFYWLTVLFTFALGTSVGDIISQRLGLGYGTCALLFGGLLGLVAIARVHLGLSGVAGFWIAYILARPLGVGLGDELSHPRWDGGLALGTLTTSVIFLAAILALVSTLDPPAAVPGSRPTGGTA